MEVVLILFIFLLLVGIVALLLFIKRQRRFGSLTMRKIYQDSERIPGETLYAKDIPLCGKPDYIIRDGDTYIPVEVKTGKTPPNDPYPNHIMQLMAYCYLTEDLYDTIVPGGVIKYPGREFRVQYTDEARESVRITVEELMQAKRENVEFTCRHAAHNS